MNTKKISCILLALSLAGCGRQIRTAQDITPGNAKENQLSWKYGANDIRIQTTKVTSELVDKWFARTGYARNGQKPRIIITQIDNRTDMVISTHMIRDIIESVAIEDGRVSIMVGDAKDEAELNELLDKITHDPKYANSTRLAADQSKAPQFLAKIRLVKALTEQKRYDIEDYRMTITLYDIETGEALDSAYDVLRKKVQL